MVEICAKVSKNTENTEALPALEEKIDTVEGIEHRVDPLMNRKFASCL